MNKRSLTILGIILLTVVITMGFSGCAKDKKETLSNKQDIQGDQKVEDINIKNQIAEFERFIKENGEKIELEKLDTTNWKTYTDKKRGFSFKYPNDWHVVEIDPSKSIASTEEPKMQKYYKKIYSESIKSQVESYEFLCIAEGVNYQKINNNKRCIPDRQGAFLDCYSDYCNFTFREFLPVLSSEKRTSGGLWLEHYRQLVNSYRSNKNESWFNKYIENKTVTIFSGNTDLQGFDFLDMQFNKLHISNYNGQINGSTFTSIYHTLIQTIERQ